MLLEEVWHWELTLKFSNMVLLSAFFLFYLSGANMIDRSHALLPRFPYQDGLYWFWSCKLKYTLSPLGSFIWVFHHSNRDAASTVKIRETQKSQTVKFCWWWFMNSWGHINIFIVASGRDMMWNRRDYGL